MSRLKLFLFLLLLLPLLAVQGCKNNAAGQNDTVFKQIPELKQIKPERSVKIKLKRSTRGDYSWDLNGEDADKVIAVDRKLRDSLRGNN